jgi:hypothetical protein
MGNSSVHWFVGMGACLSHFVQMTIEKTLRSRSQSAPYSNGVSDSNKALESLGFEVSWCSWGQNKFAQENSFKLASIKRISNDGVP